MFFFHATGGRLGNQLFQAALIARRKKPRELVVTMLMRESKAFLTQHLGYKDFSNPFLVNIADHVIMPYVIKPLIKLRIISALTQDGNVITEKKGILPFTYFRGYFQVPKLLAPTIISRSCIRPKFVKAASVTLRCAEERTPIFIHVRRTDYHAYYESAVLPLSYYWAAIEKMKSVAKDPYFFILGDDTEWCEKRFSGISQSAIPRGTPYEDLALMSLCAGGILSNSSFAWWGGELCKRTAPVIAPKYWFGWPQKEWQPRGIEESNFQFIDVE
jgi:hypothetical protein